MERMVALHRVLDSRRHPASAGELMAELECSRSTLFRTIGMLRDHLGAPIENVPGRGYVYDRDAGAFELPGLWFRRDELEALLVMDELLSRVQPGLLEEAHRSAPQPLPGHSRPRQPPGRALSGEPVPHSARARPGRCRERFRGGCNGRRGTPPACIHL